MLLLLLLAAWLGRWPLTTPVRRCASSGLSTPPPDTGCLPGPGVLQMFSPAAAKFDLSTGELNSLARQGHTLAQQQQQEGGAGGPVTLSAAGSGSSTLAPSVGGASSLAIPPPPSPLAPSPAVGSAPHAPAAAMAVEQQQAAAAAAPAARVPGALAASAPSERSLLQSGPGDGLARRSFFMRDQETPVEALQPLRVRKGGRGQQVRARERGWGGWGGSRGRRGGQALLAHLPASG